MSPPVLRFHRVALGATFEVRLAGETSADYAREALEAAWDDLAHVANELDPALAGGALDAAHRMGAAERMRVPPELRACLGLASRLRAATAGALDLGIPAGADRGVWAEARAAEWELSGEDLLCRRPGWRLDLAGLARGHALDRMGATLREWGLPRALLTAGGGLALALGEPEGSRGWRLAAGEWELRLADGALASFGGREPAEFTDPRLGHRVRLPRPHRALATSAAEAAGWARALAAASPAEAEAWAKAEPMVGLWTAEGARLGAAARLDVVSAPRS